MRINSELRTRNVAFTIIELLVYFFLLLMLMALSYAALYRYMDHSAALRRSADDIANALHAGENWRADVRAARGPVQLESNAEEQILQLHGAQGDVAYRFATNTVFRRLGSNDWSQVLDNIKMSSFVPDPRQDIAALRWELELQTRAGKAARVRPLFTFIAVPAGTSSR